MNTFDWLVIFCEGVIAAAFFFVVVMIVSQPLSRWYTHWLARRAPVFPHGKLPLAALDDYQPYDVLTHQPGDVYLPEYQPQQHPHSRSSL